MYWSDDEENLQFPTSSVLDVIYKIEGKTLPTNALSAIALSLTDQLEGWDNLENVALHLMLGGEEGNGWYRDRNPDSVLYISRRTKLVLRVEQDKLHHFSFLSNCELDVQGHKVKFVHKHNKNLQHSETLYSQHVISEFENELEFLENIKQQLQNMNVNCKKILCGKSRELMLNCGKVYTRSLMLNELSKEDSLTLLTKGLGHSQKQGCGVFVPYKSIS